MPTSDPHKLIARIVADATDGRLDDASFRKRTERAARQLQRLLEQSSAPASARPASAARGRRAGAAQRPAYRFVAVPNGQGGTTSVSLSTAIFDELAQALGGPAKVNEHARKAAVGHKPDSGVSRSAYVLRRLRQRAARVARHSDA